MIPSHLKINWTMWLVIVKGQIYVITQPFLHKLWELLPVCMLNWVMAAKSSYCFWWEKESNFLDQSSSFHCSSLISKLISLHTRSDATIIYNITFMLKDSSFSCHFNCFLTPLAHMPLILVMQLTRKIWSHQFLFLHDTERKLE